MSTTLQIDKYVDVLAKMCTRDPKLFTMRDGMMRDGPMLASHDAGEMIFAIIDYVRPGDVSDQLAVKLMELIGARGTFDARDDDD